MKTLLIKILNVFGNPFSRKTKLTSAQRIMAQEELKAEKIISFFRLSLAAVLFAAAFIAHGLSSNLIPPIIFICFTASMFFKMALISSEMQLIDQYYYSFIKYYLALYDVIWGGVTVYFLLQEPQIAQFAFAEYAGAGFAILYVISAAFFLLVDIFRYHTGTTIIISIGLFASYYINGYLLSNEMYAYPDAMLLVLIAVPSLALLNILISHQVRNLITRSKNLEYLERFLPEVVAAEVNRHGADAHLSGIEQDVTILFSDIRGFTSLTEKKAPAEVITFLNRYFEYMSECVFKNQGILDKFIGDGLMAIFASPFTECSQEAIDPSDFARRALNTALDMRDKLESFNKEIIQEGIGSIEIGIGIHSGKAVLGNIGSIRRMDFTAIGDTVNTASRIESMNKDLGTSILLSRATRGLLDTSEVQTKSCGQIQLRGKSEIMELYSV